MYVNSKERLRAHAGSRVTTQSVAYHFGNEQVVPARRTDEAADEKCRVKK